MNLPRRPTLPEPTGRWRVASIAGTLLAQAIFFGVFIDVPPRVVADNVRYEAGGLNLAEGRGLSLPYSMAEDPDVRSWVCSRHPDACLPDGTYPTAIYPPGYPLFIGAIYSVTGRSLWALFIAQLLLLLTMFWIFERLARRYLDKVGYWFAMAVAATYPFLARQAAMIMSDHLHAALLLFSLSALLLLRPGWRRGTAFGALLAAATLVRPYSLLVIPALFLWPPIRRGLRISWREWATAVVVCVLPFALWASRNAYWFGRFIPLSTTGLGVSLYHTTLEWEIGDIYEPGNPERYYRLTNAFGGDPVAWGPNHRLQDEAIARMKDRPWSLVKALAVHAPKLWVSLGREGQGVTRLWPLLVLYLGGLLLLGLVGMWVKRREPTWHTLVLTILVYWVLLLPSPAEARRTLPLRLPMLLLAAAAVSTGVRWWTARRAAPQPNGAPALGTQAPPSREK